MGAVVVPKRNLRVNAEALQRLMKLSYDLNYVRVCIDTDDDLIVMSRKMSGLVLTSLRLPLVTSQQPLTARMQ